MNTEIISFWMKTVVEGLYIYSAHSYLHVEQPVFSVEIVIYDLNSPTSQFFDPVQLNLLKG